MTPRDSDSPGVRRAWGWVAHLREGGTIPWREWAAPGPTRGRTLPGAQQLELLRRLNLAGPPSPSLVERVLSASAPGRGRPDLELEGAVEVAPFGPRPVDPGELSLDELVRVAAGLLAEDVVAAGVSHRDKPLLTRPWRTRYRLLGDPWLAEPVRAELTSRGRPPGGRGAVVVLRADALDRMLAHAWTARSLGVGAPAWTDWLSGTVRRDALPPRVDLARIARVWADRIGREQVHVVLDPAALPALVGVRRLAAAPAELSADSVEVARRVGSVLGMLVGPARRRDLLHHNLQPRLAPVPGPRLAVPAEHREWVARRAARMRDALLRGGYAVHGDAEQLLPGGRGGTGNERADRPDGAPERPAADGPSEAGTLALVVSLLLVGDADDDRYHEGHHHQHTDDDEGQT